MKDTGECFVPDIIPSANSIAGDYWSRLWMRRSKLVDAGAPLTGHDLPLFKPGYDYSTVRDDDKGGLLIKWWATN